MAPRLYVPHEYQRRAIDALLDDPYHALFMDPGLGKSSITLQAFCELRDSCCVERALIVAPLRVIYSTWPGEIAKWKQFSGLRVQNLHARFDLDAYADLWLLNPESLGKLFGKMVTLPDGKKRAWQPGPWKEWRRRPSMLVLDESSRFKNSQSIRTKTMRRYIGDFERRVALTGTPVPNGITDLFGQMLLVDGGAALGTTLGGFRERFCAEKPKRFGQKKVLTYEPRDTAFDEVRGLIAPRVTALDADDWLQLPDRIDTAVPVPIPEHVMRKYREAKRDAATQLDSGHMLFARGGASSKLKQIANGRAYLKDPLSGTQETVWLHDAKADALADLLEELGRPALIAYEYTCDGEYLEKRFGFPRIRGGMSLAETSRIIDRWNRRELPGLLCQPQAMSHGLNMQDGSDAIVWYGPSWDAEVWIQFNARLCRQGQTSPSVHNYVLVAQGTVDERIWEVLQGKEVTQEALLAALKREMGA